MLVSGMDISCNHLMVEDTWNDVTPNLPFSIEHFKEIVFAGSTVYIATDKGGFFFKKMALSGMSSSMKWENLFSLNH